MSSEMIFQKIRRLFDRLSTNLMYKWRLGRIGKRSYVRCVRSIVGGKHVFIGNNTRIHEDATLYAVRKYSTWKYFGEIHIGNGVFVNYGVNLTAACKIIIEDDVTFGWNVAIIDFDHDFKNSYGSVIESPLVTRGNTTVGKGAWIGANAIIRGGICIGKNCVVAAGSVVLKDVPDNTIVGGNPAKSLSKIEREIS